MSQLKNFVYLKWHHSMIFGRFLLKKELENFTKRFPIQSFTHDLIFQISQNFSQQWKKSELWQIAFPSFLFSEKGFGFNFKKKQNLKLFKESRKNELVIASQKTRFPAAQYADFAGIDIFLQKIQELIEWPLKYGKIFEKHGIFSGKGILLTGPSGTGKTFLAHVIAGELRIPLFYLSSISIFSSFNGKGGKKIREIFSKAEKISPSIIFIDDIDYLSSRREFSSRESEKKILAQLLVCMENLEQKKKRIIVLAATNRINEIDDSLTRSGRFDKQIEFKFPGYSSRLEILTFLTSGIVLENQFDFKKLTLETKGFSPGNLCELVRMASKLAVSRTGAKFFKGKFRAKNFDNFSFFRLKQVDFQKAFSLMNPIFFRQGMIPSPKISWKEIGGLEETRKILSDYIVQPIKNPTESASRKKTQFGVLLYGPPGCGKTLIAQALAFESGASFISVKGPEILDKFLGESEKAIRNLFEKARTCSPTIIFFDEFDSIATKRSSNGGSSTQGATDRVVNQLLTEMDGTEKNDLIFFLAATNRPDMIDRALLRPGRIDKLVFVPFPSRKEEISILKTISDKLSCLPHLNFSSLVESWFIPLSGADLFSCSREAEINSQKKKINYCLLKSMSKGLKTEVVFCLAFDDFSNGISKVLKNSFSKKNFFLKNRKHHLS